MSAISDTIKATRAECFLKSTFLSISRVPKDVSTVEAIAAREYDGRCVCLVGWGESTTRVVLVDPRVYRLLQSSCLMYCSDFPAKPHLHRISEADSSWCVQLPGLCRTHMKPIDMHNLPLSSTLRVVAWSTGIGRHEGKLIVMFAEFPRPIIASDELASIVNSFVCDMMRDPPNKGSLVITTDTVVKRQTVAPKTRKKTLAIVGYTQTHPAKIQVEQIK